MHEKSKLTKYLSCVMSHCRLSKQCARGVDHRQDANILKRMGFNIEPSLPDTGNVNGIRVGAPLRTSESQVLG